MVSVIKKKNHLDTATLEAAAPIMALGASTEKVSPHGCVITAALKPGDHDLRRKSVDPNRMNMENVKTMKQWQVHAVTSPTVNVDARCDGTVAN